MKYISFILFTLLLCSCEEEKHPLLVDDDKAISLLMDLNIASIALKKYPVSYRDSMSNVYKTQISSLHGLDKEELDSVLWLMQQDLDRYNKLYRKLEDSLELLEEKLSEVDTSQTVDIPIEAAKTTKKIKAPQ